MLKLVTAPASEPVTTAQAMDWLRVGNREIDTIAKLITAARQKLENVYNPRRCLVEQTWDVILDGFPIDNGDLVLPILPVRSITSIGYIDPAGAAQVLDVDGLRLTAGDWRSTLALLPGANWPTGINGSGAVTLRVVAGYSEAPADLQMDVLGLVGFWFDNRDKINQLPPGWSSNYRMPVLA